MREQILEIMRRDLMPFPNRQDNLEYTEEDVILIAETFAKQFKTKADLWDKLDEKVGKYYDEDNAEYFDEMGLVSIGEICASSLGYL